MKKLLRLLSLKSEAKELEKKKEILELQGKNCDMVKLDISVNKVLQYSAKK